MPRQRKARKTAPKPTVQEGLDRVRFNIDRLQGQVAETAKVTQRLTKALERLIERRAVRA